MRHPSMWAAGAFIAAAPLVGLALAGTSEANPAVASATLVDITGNEVGHALFTSRGDGSVVATVKVTIDNSLTGNPGEFHGFHIHANNDDDTGDGDTNDGCITYAAGTEPSVTAWFTQVDGHWDAGGHVHGAHTGDLPVLLRQGDGEAEMEFVVDKFAAGDLPGRALIVHFLADDFGRHDDAGSLTTGNAGARYACGEIVPTAAASG